MNRREFSKSLLASIASFALMDSLFALDAIGKPIQPITKHWLAQLNDYCGDLKKAGISPTKWQAAIAELYQQVELADLLRLIDFDRLQKGFEFPDLGVNTKPVKFPKLEGLPEQTAFIKKMFGMKKGRAIIPHGHSNMVSAHLLLQGEMHLRHYEKLEQREQHLVIQPSIDRIIQAGDHSSISDERDNVHWFIAQSDHAFTFDVIVADLNSQSYDIHNLDMEAQKSLGNGRIVVPIMDVEAALKKYGKEMHH